MKDNRRKRKEFMSYPKSTETYIIKQLKQDNFSNYYWHTLPSEFWQLDQAQHYVKFLKDKEKDLNSILQKSQFKIYKVQEVEE